MMVSSRYPSEFDMTSSHKLRSSDDMQFAFSYFYFMMSEKLIANYSAIFTELDTDKTGYGQTDRQTDRQTDSVH